MEGIGSLTAAPALERPELLASPVSQALGALVGAGGVGVAEIDPTLSDTAAFCEHYGIGMEQAANCIVLKAKNGGYAALVVLGSTRADVNGTARREVGARVSFAPMDEAVKETGMEYGAITPIGLPAAWPIFIDKAVADSPRIVIGSGLRASKLILPGTLLAPLPNARVIDDLSIHI
ncbi:MAG TPA: YbaK/EbsC family protein [Candidatus Paceibacterota bacterium]